MLSRACDTAPFDAAAREQSGMVDLSLQERMPEIYEEMVDVFGRLEAHFGDMQDVEFTVQDGKLFILQTRSGKRTTRAAIKIAVDMVAAGQIDDGEALLRLDPASFEQLLHPTLDPSAKIDVLCRGLPASPGRPAAGFVFPPIPPRWKRRAAKMSFWCAWKPAPKIFTACMPRARF